MQKALLLTLVMLPTGVLHALSPAPKLTTSGDPAAGHVTLEWATDEPSNRYQLQESRTADFADPVTRYDGPHTSSVRSGLLDGVRYYRVRRQVDAGDGASVRWSAWSEPVRFEVAHHSRSLALSLCAVGAAVFLCTLGFLLRASRWNHD